MRRLALLLGLVLAAAPAAAHHEPIRRAEPDAQRRALGEFLAARRLPCGAVRAVFLAGRLPDGTAVWDVACDGGRAWRLVLRHDEAAPDAAWDCRSPLLEPCFQPIPRGWPGTVRTPAARCEALCFIGVAEDPGACLARCLAEFGDSPPP